MPGADRGRSVAAMPATITPTSGTRLHYDERRGGAAILCIHGTGSGAFAWAPAIPELARRGRVISYDRRGFSRSRSAEAGRPVSVADMPTMRPPSSTRSTPPPPW